MKETTKAVTLVQLIELCTHIWKERPMCRITISVSKRIRVTIIEDEVGTVGELIS